MSDSGSRLDSISIYSSCGKSAKLAILEGGDGLDDIRSYYGRGLIERIEMFLVGKLPTVNPQVCDVSASAFIKFLGFHFVRKIGWGMERSVATSS
jgi:hypothetical protein